LINTQNIAAKLAAFGEKFSDQIEEIVAGESFGCTALTEPGMGSDFTAIETTAKKVKGGWELNGEKAWITNADIADWFLVYAQSKKVGDRSGIASYLVHSNDAGFQRGASATMLGGHAIGAGGFQLNNLFVPESRALSAGGTGFKSAMAGVNSARVYVAAMCVGIVSDALDQAIVHTQKRTAFGKPLIENQGLRWSLSDVATELAAMRALTYEAGRAVEEQSDAILLAAQAKKFATERSVNLIERCMQSMGAQGLETSNSVGRHLIAAKIAGYTDGTIEMMNERVGASLLKK
jgi:alkylation response protein AidB-like acyl-CoA dehydrogenase